MVVHFFKATPRVFGVVVPGDDPIIADGIANTLIFTLNSLQGKEVVGHIPIGAKVRPGW